MARLIDATKLAEQVCSLTMYIYGVRNGKTLIKEAVEKYRDAVLRKICEAPTVETVDAKKYEALLEMYHDLRENFIDFYCSGNPNVAPYCLNRCKGCVTPFGWCRQNSDECKGFNPAEVILDEERRTE